MQKFLDYFKLAVGLILIAVTAMMIGIIIGAKVYKSSANETPASDIEVYGRVTEVIGFDFDYDIVIVEDNMGFRWSFYGIEDWCIGDIAVLTLNTKGTELIFDDEIVSVRYSGTVENFK